MGDANERQSAVPERVSVVSKGQPNEPANRPPPLPPLPPRRPKPPRAPLPVRGAAVPPPPPPQAVAQSRRPPPKPSAPPAPSKPPSRKPPPPPRNSIELDFESLGVAALPPPTIDPVAAPKPKRAKRTGKKPAGTLVRLVPWILLALVAGVGTFVALRPAPPPPSVALSPIQVQAQSEDQGGVETVGTGPAQDAPRVDPVTPPSPMVEMPADAPEAAGPETTPDSAMTAMTASMGTHTHMTDTGMRATGTATATMTATMSQPSPVPMADSSLPEVPSRDEVQRAMLSVRGAVRQCMDRGGRVPIRVTIVGRTGRITTAQVQDAYFARQPTGACIARAVRGARFPRFARDRLVVVYPYDF